MFTHEFLNKTSEVIREINAEHIEAMVKKIEWIRNSEGRLFILGVGGSSANASHAVNDFRKLTNIECYSPTDNISELTARTNDNGWESIFVDWLKVSKLNSFDGILLLSVGGGNIERNLSMNLVKACEYAFECGTDILSIVGKDGGQIKKMSDISIIIPPTYPELITPITESIQSIILHLLVTHPLLAKNNTTW